MAKFAVVYDACVLYPAPLRDLLMRLAVTDLYQAHWTDHIHQEWINALIKTNQYSLEKLEKVKYLMDVHVRDAKVTGKEPLLRTHLKQHQSYCRFCKNNNYHKLV